MTWGNADHGGDSSAVRDQLKKVHQIQSTQRAFAANRMWRNPICDSGRKGVPGAHMMIVRPEFNEIRNPNMVKNSYEQDLYIYTQKTKILDI